MNTKQAIYSLKDILDSSTPLQLQHLVTILELGAGDLFLRLDTLRPCSEAEERANKLLQVTHELVDAIVYSTCDSEDNYQPDAPFVPCYAGNWELVLATLIIDQDWPKIAQTAHELRIEHANP